MLLVVFHSTWCGWLDGKLGQVTLSVVLAPKLSLSLSHPSYTHKQKRPFTPVDVRGWWRGQLYAAAETEAGWWGEAVAESNVIVTLFGGQPPTNHHYFCCCCCRCSSHEPLDVCGRKGVKRWAVIESERPNRVKCSTPFFPTVSRELLPALGRDFEVSVFLHASVLGQKLGGVSKLVQVFTVIHFFRPCLSTFSGHTTVIHFFLPSSKTLSGHCHIIINFFRWCPRTFLGQCHPLLSAVSRSQNIVRSLCHNFLAAVSEHSQVTVS